MKDKVLIFIIGLLVGLIIATAGFLVYFKFFANVNQSGGMQMDETGQMGDPPDGQGGNGGEEPPEMPDGSGGGEPSELVSDGSATT